MSDARCIAVVYCLDLASTAANITTTPADSVAFFAVTDCDAGDVRFATATADGAGHCPLAAAFRTQNSVWHQLPHLSSMAWQRRLIRFFSVKATKWTMRQVAKRLRDAVRCLTRVTRYTSPPVRLRRLLRLPATRTAARCC